MSPRSQKAALAWLATRPSLPELQSAYPAEWPRVKRDLDALVDTGDPAALQAFAAGLSAGPSRDLRDQVRRQMAAEALKQLSLAAATGVTSGRIRFNLLNGFLAQRLLFAEGLRRKPVSLAAFRLLWPLLWQRRLLMPLVQPKGIYCFYSRALVRELAALVGGRPALEIAAGDGTLSRFLAAEGVTITATDDHSWSHVVAFPADVVRQDAVAALRERAPEVVVCSFPPAGNAFEQAVFATPSVQLYVVVNARLDVGSGNRAAYAAQTGFDWAEEPRLSWLVLPPELGARVEVFRRKAVA